MIPASCGTDLVFNMVEELLFGEIDGVKVNAKSVSGGRAGSKERGVVNVLLANNPFSTGVKKAGDRPGGAIPLRKFSLQTHEKRQNWIRLLPLADQDLNGRDGFAIHGRGSRGSDGCIVPKDFHNVLLLHRLVSAREAAGGPQPTLAVIAAGDLERFERLGRLA